ncbi:MAG: acyl-CoA dehydrogenase family protein, partial [Dyadobacter sp.]
MIEKTVRDFAAKEIKPNISQWDEEQFFPKNIFHQL